MKNTRDIKLLKTELTNNIDNIYSIIKKIKKEYEKTYIDKTKKILYKIAIDHNLDYDELQNKYLKIKTNIIPKDTNIEELLSKITINDTNYYYESKENGNVYTLDGVNVGNFKNNKIIINDVSYSIN